MTPRITIFCVYFGSLPEYTDLWLYSCGMNPSIQWVLITDQSVNSLTLPPNVSTRHEELQVFAEYLGSYYGFSPNVERAYKICDFKPAYSALLKRYSLECEFWGHCDLDVVFGDLSAFISDERLARFDRLFGRGHLSIYRNDQISNTAFRFPHPYLKWRDVFESADNFGFDEHRGVDSIWRQHRMEFLNVEIAADIEPMISVPSLVNPLKNLRHQIFVYTEGRILQIGRTLLGKASVIEYAYIHFQKRKIRIDGVVGADRHFVLLPDKFKSVPNINAIEQEYPRGVRPYSLSELLSLLRMGHREVRRALREYREA